MPRRLLNLLTACCLLLFVAAGVLWVRSLSTSDGLLLTSPDGNPWWAICREGRVGVLTVRAWPYPIPPRYASVPFAAAHVGP